MKRTKYLVKSSLAGVVMVSTLLALPVYAQNVTVSKLAAAPVLDGQASDWGGVASHTIPLEGKLEMQEVSLSAGVHGDDIYLLLKWKDDDADQQHKPYVWNSGKKKYEAGPQREDRFAIQFGMEGDYSTDWLSGKQFKADTWHWKAARTNPSGLAHDKMTVISGTAAKKSYKATDASGNTLYIQRPSDAGDKIYKTKRYRGYEQDVMPKYILTKNPSGSVTDVKAAGHWVNGEWTLELRRKLNTGHSDDVAFSSGVTVPAGIAVFDHTGDDKHNISGIFDFSIE